MKKITTILLLVFLLTLLLKYWQSKRGVEYSSLDPDAINLVDESSSKAFPASHYMQADVEPSISMFTPLQKTSGKVKPKGGVVSHHLLASDNIAKYFQTLSAFNYSRVIIFAPNHGEIGEKHLVTSLMPWETPYGSVLADTAAINLLSSLGNISVSDEVLASDHSAEVIMPFIKTYLSEAKVIPILVSTHTSDDEIETTVSQVKELLDENTFVLVSSDFSHYLLPSVAKLKDIETLSLLKSYNLSRLRKLGNDHIDSPVSIVLLLKLMESIQAKNLVVADHTDASTIVGTPYTPTTSYFFLYYYE